jgi:hypothetical protein
LDRARPADGLGYKPFAGDLSPFERDQLHNLGMNVRMADSIISQLLAETDRRRAAETTRLIDVDDFVLLGRAPPKMASIFVRVTDPGGA